MSEKILCVDDEANVLSGYQRNLRKHFIVETALGGHEALATVERDGPFAVIVSDMRMPGMDGVQFLSKIKVLAPDSVRMMLTGNADQGTAMEAVNKGCIFRFLTKPCTPEDLINALRDGIAQHRLIKAERELLEQTLNGSVKVLTEVLSIVEPQSFGRSQALYALAREYAQSQKMANAWELELGAMLSQVGYVTIPADVIAKTRTNRILSGVEKDMLVRVPEIGSNLLANIRRLEPVAQAVLYQEKHFDGSGFPFDATKGEEIPFVARILKILSDLLHLEKNGKCRALALAELQGRAGLYDPAILKSVAAMLTPPPSSSSDTPGEGISKKPQELGIGMLLCSDIETCNGQLLIAAGHRITETLLERIRNYSRLVGIREPIWVQVDMPPCANPDSQFQDRIGSACGS